MENTEIKKHRVLFAKDPCIMKGSNKPTLTVGKKYYIKGVSKSRFFIIDDDETKHYFKLNDVDGMPNWTKYFSRKPLDLPIEERQEETKPITADEMHLNMQYYMEFCQRNIYVTPQDWIKKHKHF